MKKSLIKLMLCSILLLVPSCGIDTDAEDNSNVDSRIQEVYELYKANGGTLSYDEWIKQIRGEKGEDGKSAYDIAVEKGFKGTQEEWLASLKGKDGRDGNLPSANGHEIIGASYTSNGEVIIYYDDGTYKNIGQVNYDGTAPGPVDPGDAPYDPNLTFHAMGSWDLETPWTASHNNRMTPVSLNYVQNVSNELYQTLLTKNVKYIYEFDLNIPSISAGWPQKARTPDGTVIQVDGNYAIKVVKARWVADEESYVHEQWITNPADVGAQNAESLTDNVFIPPYQKEMDADGFSWVDNPTIIDGGSSYKFFAVEYNEKSTETVCGYGFAAIRIS